jgi:hypothetical protein
MNDIFEERLIRCAGRCPAGNASIGKDDVQAAEIPGEVGEEPLPILGDGNVGAITVRFRSQFGDRFVQSFWIATGKGNFRPFRDEEARGRKTDSAVASRDESFLARQFHISSSMADHQIIYDDRHTNGMMTIIDGGCQKNALFRERDCPET